MNTVLKKYKPTTDFKLGYCEESFSTSLEHLLKQLLCIEYDHSTQMYE